MKKLASIVLSLVIVLSFATTVSAQSISLSYDGKTYKYTGATYSLKVNGEVVSSDVPVIVMSGRSMVPVRALFEKLGGTAAWNSSTQKMTVSYNGYSIVLTSNSKNAVINGKTYDMGVPAKKINERLMFPAAALKSQLNFNITLSGTEGALLIDTFGSLKNISLSNSGGTDIVAISAERYKEYNITRLTDTNRLVIDLYNIKAPEKEVKINEKGSFVNAIRYRAFNSSTARVVLDMNGQQPYTVEEKDGQLVVVIQAPTYRNIDYSNNGDRTGFLLDDAVLTDGMSVNTQKYYTGNYDETGKKYTMTFDSSSADIGTGIMNINDTYLNSVEITNDPITNKTSMTFNAKTKLFYEVVTRNDAGNTAITFLKPAADNEKLVVIDPGHGGFESGAVSGSILEKNLNLDISLKLNSILKKNGVKTYIIREDDSYVGIAERAFIANDLNATLFLCVHNNSTGSSTSNGTMTLYYPDPRPGWSLTGQQFANIIQGKLISSLKTKNLSIIKRPDLGVLRLTTMPAALAEVAFMSNKTDRNNLLSDAFRQKAAQALADAVMDALKKAK